MVFGGGAYLVQFMTEIWWKNAVLRKKMIKISMTRRENRFKSQFVPQFGKDKLAIKQLDLYWVFTKLLELKFSVFSSMWGFQWTIFVQNSKFPHWGYLFLKTLLFWEYFVVSTAFKASKIDMKRLEIQFFSSGH